MNFNGQRIFVSIIFFSPFVYFYFIKKIKKNSKYRNINIENHNKDNKKIKSLNLSKYRVFSENIVINKLI